jgi:hypothetical protein
MKKFVFAFVALFTVAGAAYATDNYVAPVQAQAVAAQCDVNCQTSQNVVAQSHSSYSTTSAVVAAHVQTVRVVERVVQPQIYHQIQTVVAQPVQAVVQRQYIAAPVVQQVQVQHSYVRQNVVAAPVIAQQNYVAHQNVVAQQNYVQRQNVQQLNQVGHSYSNTSNFQAQRSGGLFGGRLFNQAGGGRTVTRSLNFSASKTKSR